MKVRTQEAFTKLVELSVDRIITGIHESRILVVLRATPLLKIAVWSITGTSDQINKHARGTYERER